MNIEVYEHLFSQNFHPCQHLHPAPLLWTGQYILCCQLSLLGGLVDIRLFSLCHLHPEERRAKEQAGALPHIIQICGFKWKRAGCSVLQLCLCPCVQIENIDACLSFLAAKGVNIQGLSAEGKPDSCASVLTRIRAVDPGHGQAWPGLVRLSQAKSSQAKPGHA